MIETVGQIEGSKDIEVHARVSGTLTRQAYQEGDPVKAGATLFTIDREPFEIALAQERASPVVPARFHCDSAVFRILRFDQVRK